MGFGWLCHGGLQWSQGVSSLIGGLGALGVKVIKRFLWLIGTGGQIKVKR